MRMQSHPNLCGPAALANAFRTLGRAKITEDKVVAAIRETASASESAEQDGAGVRSLQRAAEKFGFALAPHTCDSFTSAWAYVLFCLRQSKPCLLAVDSGQSESGHWITAIGETGPNLLIADPAEAEVVLPISAFSLDNRWKDDQGKYYFLVLNYVPKKRKR